MEGRRTKEEGCRVEAGEFEDGQEQGMKKKGIGGSWRKWSGRRIGVLR